ncbi:MAG: phosphotransferase family protein, partial [Gammaproteobacteria bacterium]
PLEPDWPRRADRRAAMRDVLERLRAVPATVLPPLDLPARAQLLHGRLAVRDAARAAGHASAVEEALAAWHAAAPPSGSSPAASSPAEPSADGIAAPCLVHGDLTPGNILVRGDGSLLLLDWEYAHAGGPWDDLAALCAGAQCDPFPDWAADVPAGERARFEAACGLRRSLDALWYALAATLGDGPRTGIRARPEAH